MNRKIWLGLLAIVVVTAVLHTVRTDIVPQLIRRELLNLLHVLGFAAISIVVTRTTLQITQGKKHAQLRAYVLSALFLVTLAFASEWLQVFVRNRSASFGDFARDLTGLVAGIAFVASMTIEFRPKRLFVIVSGIASLLVGLSEPSYAMVNKIIARFQHPSIANFENDRDRYLLRPFAAWVRPIDAPPQWSNSGRILDVHARRSQGFAGFSLINFYRDWSAYRTLAFTASSLTDEAVMLNFRVRDVASTRNALGQFSRTFEVEGNPKTFRIPLTEISEASSQRSFDISRVNRLEFYTEDAPGFRIDDIRLE